MRAFSQLIFRLPRDVNVCVKVTRASRHTCICLIPLLHIPDLYTFFQAFFPYKVMAFWFWRSACFLNTLNCFALHADIHVQLPLWHKVPTDLDPTYLAIPMIWLHGRVMINHSHTLRNSSLSTVLSLWSLEHLLLWLTMNRLVEWTMLGLLACTVYTKNLEETWSQDKGRLCIGWVGRR